jgi:hypothetical protein
MFLNASVALSGEDRLKCSFTMPARATHLNRHGASVHLSRDLVVGSVIVVRNKRSTQVSARIVAQMSATEEVSTYNRIYRAGRPSKQFLGNNIPLA